MMFDLATSVHFHFQRPRKHHDLKQLTFLVPSRAHRAEFTQGHKDT